MAVIAYLIDTIACDTAGTQRQLLETIRRLDRDRFRPHLICLWESPWMRENPLPCPVHVLGHQGFLKPGFPGVVKRLAALLDELDVAIMQVFFDEAIFVGWLGARRSRRRPLLLSSRRDMGLGAGNQPWYHGLFRLALPLVNRDFAGIVANSDMVRHYAASREHTPLAKFVVLRNGVDAPPATPCEPNAGAAGRPVLVGIVASLTPVKRHDLLLEAWARVRRHAGPGAARLVLIGDGPLREPLAAQAAALGLGDDVEFVGAVTDVPAQLRRLDAGVLCSDREGLSNAVLEYMASGLAVVATAVGGNPELVDQRNGLLVPAGDAEALAGAIGRLVADAGLRRRLGEAGRERVVREFGWDASLRALTGLYESLLAGRGLPNAGPSA